MNIGKNSRKSGKILKAHGKLGEILISSDFDLTENLKKLESIFIAIDGELVPFFIETFIFKSSRTAAVKLEDIDAVEEANELIGSEWYVPEEITPLLNPEDQPTDELIGFTVVDQHNNTIGEITDFQEIPSNNLIEVKKKGKTYDIPFNEETIISIDTADKIVTISIPEGLLDL